MTRGPVIVRAGALACGLWLAACGDNRAAPTSDAGACATAPCPCTAVLTGNVADTTRSADTCPVLEPGSGPSTGHTMLDFLVISQALGTQLGVRIDLGAVATTGTYSSATTRVWSAIAIKNVPVHGACVFTAGSTSVPAGNFTLTVDSIAKTIDDAVAHGSLAVTMFVLPQTTEAGAQTDCGPGPTEDLALTF
jgi:hypothetical protein